MSDMILLTALPGGIDAATGNFRISVFASPRLDGSSTTIAGTPFEHWTATAAALSFGVSFNLGAAVPATLAPTQPAFDGALWTNVFPSTTPAKAFVFRDYKTGSSFSSYGASSIAKVVRDTYTSTAAASPNRPQVVKGGADAVTSAVNQVSAALLNTLSVGKQVAPVAGQSSLTFSKQVTNNALPNTDVHIREFVRAAVFYNRRDWRQQAGVASITTQPPAPQIVAPDFHQIVGHLGDHPQVMRRLGLVIDLLVTPPAGLTRDPTQPVSVQLVVGAIAGLNVITPSTVCSVSNTDFLLSFYGDSDILSPGFLVFNTDAFHVDDMDLDHAATHVSDFADDTQAKLDRAANDPASSSTPIEVALPALRTCGFAVHHGDKESKLAGRLSRPWQLADPTKAKLSFEAEDFIRGYRIDASKDGGSWQSLCHRDITFTAGSGSSASVVKISDEGFIKSGAMASSATGVPLFNVHESVFHWSGWSLVAARPGLSIGTGVRNNGQSETPAVPNNDGTADLGLALKVDIRATQGTLPRLRFGSTYQFRARAVDLAGNDLPHGAPAAPSGSAPANLAADCATAPYTFRRYEPVSPPTLVLRAELTEGESVEHLVIRSDPHGPTPRNASDYATWIDQQRASNPSYGMMADYTATCERHVAPPKTTQHMAELHGAFDAILKAPITSDKAKLAWAVALKEDGTFFDRSLTDISTGQKTISAVLRIVSPPAVKSAPGGAPTGTNIYPPPDGAADSPPIYGPDCTVPRGEPLGHGQYVIHPVDVATLPYLPDVNAAGLCLQGIGASFVARTFAPASPGGAWPEIGTFRLVLRDGTGNTAPVINGADGSSSATLDVLLPPGTLVRAKYSSTIANPAIMALTPSGQSTLVQNGLHALLSPARELWLVHAVQRPPAPSFFDYRFGVGTRNEGDTSCAVAAGADDVDGASVGHMDFVAAWNEFLDVSNPADPTWDPSANPIPKTATLATVNVAYAANGADIPPNTRHAFNDTKRRTVHYRFVATTRYREYFPLGITSDPSNITASSPTQTCVFPASARPPAPKLAYIVPTFKFANSQSGTTQTRTRKGSALRVFVERGWFASGEDERLAVLLAATGTTAANFEALHASVSVWGSDPIWFGQSALAQLDETRFVADTSSDPEKILRGVALENGSGTVTAVTYLPQFDVDKQLWYFDIEMDTGGAYFPFVRLALARCQPVAIGDLRLSRLVLADFAQPAPDRTISVVPTGGGNYSVTLSGPFASNIAGTTSTAGQATSGMAVVAEFQEAINTRGDAVDWQILGGRTMLDPTIVSGAITFQGNISFPDFLATTGARHRILVRQYETYGADNQDGIKQGTGFIHAGDPSASPWAQRLVYADAVEIAI